MFSQLSRHTARSLAFPSLHPHLARQFTAQAAATTLSAVSKAQQNILNIKFADHTDGHFHLLWLWDNCPSRRQAHSGQKIGFVSDLKASDLDTVTQGAQISFEKNKLSIQWRDQTTSVFDGHWLRKQCYSKSSLDANRQSRKPKDLITFINDDLHGKLPEVHFDEVMSDDKGVLKWLNFLDACGLCLVRGTPVDDKTVLKLAERIGPIMSTLYGAFFDVKAEPNPINIAYTDVHLGAHVDLAYYESPPGIQFLHCIRFDDSVKGGESTFVDAFAAAEELRKQDHGAFVVLCSVPATFQKDHMARQVPAQMFYQRPHIVVNEHKDVTGVFWSPPFEGPLRVPSHLVEPYYHAYHKLAALINDSKREVSFRLQKGDTVTFNQRRALHGRNAFDSQQGTRHLQGCYINIDDYLSRLRALRIVHNSPLPGIPQPDTTSRAGNCDHN